MEFNQVKELEKQKELKESSKIEIDGTDLKTKKKKYYSSEFFPIIMILLVLVITMSATMCTLNKRITENENQKKTEEKYEKNESINND
ncbi:MAG: hypothetical protein ACRCUS_07875 [Anaerovoracaceae bacterium]